MTPESSRFEPLNELARELSSSLHSEDDWKIANRELNFPPRTAAALRSGPPCHSVPPGGEEKCGGRPRVQLNETTDSIQDSVLDQEILLPWLGPAHPGHPIRFLRLSRRCVVSRDVPTISTACELREQKLSGRIGGTAAAQCAGGNGLSREEGRECILKPNPGEIPVKPGANWIGIGGAKPGARGCSRQSSGHQPQLNNPPAAVFTPLTERTEQL